jgi:hypothetical protein
VFNSFQWNMPCSVILLLLVAVGTPTSRDGRRERW